MIKQCRVGILTWHYYSNFGSSLQAYALQTAIASLGFDVQFINYHNLRFGKTSHFWETIKLVTSLSIGKLPFRFASKFSSGRKVFEHRYLRCGDITQDIKKLPSITSNYFALVCGSDQIWAPNCYNPVYFAAFAKSGIRKVSYAASIGLNSIPENLVPVYAEHLSDFYAISVREEEGKALLKDKCGVESTVVLDPTLLLRAENYIKIEKRISYIRNTRFLFVYLLNTNHQYEKQIREYARKRNLQIIGVSSKTNDRRWMTHLSNLGADQFIWLIHHADAVFTDSYHGTIFSLLFHKNVYTFLRFLEDDPINQNSRIRQLQQYFGLAGHIITESDSIDETITIDFDYFETQLGILRERSFAFLRDALR